MVARWLDVPVDIQIDIAIAPRRDRAASATPGPLRSAIDPADAHIFHFKIILNAVLRAFAADAGFLHAAKRRDLG